MAEIEHFVDPEDKSHVKFNDVKNQKLKFLPASIQLEGKTEPIQITIGEAVTKVILNNIENSRQ